MPRRMRTRCPFLLVGILLIAAPPVHIVASRISKGQPPVNPETYREIDSYAGLTEGEEKMHLDNLVDAINISKPVKGVIVLRTPKASIPDSKRRVCKTLDYIVNERNLDPSLIYGLIIGNDDRAKSLTELWTLPLDVETKLPVYGEHTLEKLDIQIISGTQIGTSCRY